MTLTLLWAAGFALAVHAVGVWGGVHAALRRDPESVLLALGTLATHYAGPVGLVLLTLAVAARLLETS